MQHYENIQYPNTNLPKKVLKLHAKHHSGCEMITSTVWLHTDMLV